MADTLYTFGYEGLSLDRFIICLKAHHVRTVLDVRAIPLSRKRGFSKTGFAAALHQAGIVYAHLPAMGCPKPIRDRYKADGDWGAYTKAFLAYLGRQQEAIAELARIASRTNCCLVCFEADFNRCHRTYVGRAVVRVAGLRLVHLTDRTTIPDVAVRTVA